MKKLIGSLLALFTVTTVASAQQINAGVSARHLDKTPVVDVVAMAPEVAHLILYGQVTFATTVKRPELTAAVELPLINKSHFYIGFDNGAGWYPVDGKYPTATWVTGATSWVPITKRFGLYGMLSATPNVKGSATGYQGGAFIQVF